MQWVPVLYIFLLEVSVAEPVLFWSASALRSFIMSCKKSNLGKFGSSPTSGGSVTLFSYGLDATKCAGCCE